MKNNTQARDKLFISTTKTRLVIWLITLIVFFAFSYLVDPTNPGWKDYLDRPLILLEDLIWVVGICIIIAEVSLLIDRILNRKLSWKGQPYKRIFIQAFLQIIGSLTIFTTTEFVLNKLGLENAATYYGNNLTGLWQWVAMVVMVSLVISAINTGNYLLKNWINTEVEATQHKLEAAEHQQAAMAAELHALKLQIDPHFIFNNLSVLSELILDDQQLGHEYAEKFALVYRYLLLNSQKDVIALEEELKFLDSYIFLTQQRIGEGVKFTIDIDKAVLDKFIPPLSLQLLVENAIKHNKTSQADPLTIKIQSINENEILVFNSVSPLVNKPSSSGIGLQNIINRYALLSDKKPVFEKTPDSFSIKLPLLSYVKDYTDHRG